MRVLTAYLPVCPNCLAFPSPSAFIHVSFCSSVPTVLLSCSPSHNSTCIVPSFKFYFFGYPSPLSSILLTPAIIYRFLYFLSVSYPPCTLPHSPERGNRFFPYRLSESRGVKRWEREADCLLSTSAKMKNTHYAPSCPSAYIKYMRTYILTYARAHTHTHTHTHTHIYIYIVWPMGQKVLDTRSG